MDDDEHAADEHGAEDHGAGPPAPTPTPGRGGLPRWSVFAVCCCLLCGAVWLADWRSKRRDQDDACRALREAVAARIADEGLDSARVTLDRAKVVCDPSSNSELDVLENRLATKRKKVADRATQNAKALAAANERAAVEKFPAVAAEVGEEIKAAKLALARGDIQAATNHVLDAQLQLKGFEGTSVVYSKELGALDLQAVELRRKVQPYIDKIQEKADAAALAAAAQREDDRRHGVMFTRPGFVAATTLGSFERALKYAAAHDTEGLGLLIKDDPEVLMFKEESRVVPFERAGPGQAYVHVRIKGSLVELWTLADGLRQP